MAGLRLLARVGYGGEGEVWEARDVEGRRRALKLVRPEALAAADELTRRGAFLRRIDHPALVRVHRTGRLTGSSLDGWGFLEMDFVDGDPLTRAPADPDALNRLEPLAEALDLLHEGRWSDGVPLVHRDVKPANLIERPDGDVVLVDCSTLRGTDATQLTRIGTPLYAAPEVMTGRVGPPADVYSFAATIVALATGARGEALSEVLTAPEELDLPDTVGRALDPDPAARPRSCRAVLEAGTAIDLDDLPDLRNWQAPPESWPGPWSGSADGAGEWYQAQRGPHDPLVPPPRRRTAPWLAGLLTIMAAAAAGAWGARVDGALPGIGVPDGPAAAWPVIAALLAGALHLGLTRLAGQPWVTVVLAPPAAWAWLLGARAAAPGRVRAWARAALLGTLGVGTVGGVAAAVSAGSSVEPVGFLPAVPWGAFALLASAVLAPVVVAAAGAHGLTGALARLVLTPVWAVGVVLLLLAGLVVLALAPVKRDWTGPALLTGTLAGAGALVGSRPAAVVRRGPDPRA